MNTPPPPPSDFKKRMATLDAQIAAKIAKPAEGGAFSAPAVRHDATAPLGDIIGSMFRVRRCVDCGNEFEGIIGRCIPCSESRIEIERQQEQATRDKARLAYWHSICPPSYRETDWAHPSLSRPVISIAGAWYPGRPEKLTPDIPGSLSLGLFGVSGAGKTRAGFHILSRHYERGWNVYAVHAAHAWDNSEHVQGLSSAAALQYSDNDKTRESARRCLEKARTCGILLLDDVGKERAGRDGTVSEAVGEAVYSLIEYRVSHNKPIVWTCNMDAGDLESRLGADRGVPILRRLKDVSELPEL